MGNIKVIFCDQIKIKQNYLILKEKKRYKHDLKTGLPVLLDVSVARNAEIAVSAEAEQVAAFAFELTAVDVSETALL